MKSKILKTFVFFVATTLLSCSQNEDSSTQSVNTPLVEVVTIDNLPSITRSTSSLEECKTKALRFRDENSFDKTVKSLSEMNADEKKAFFSNLGFKGAYTIEKEADEELDKVFDIEDDKDFLKTYSDFKSKYGDLFAYNDTDKYDLSPYLKFTDNNLSIVGNIDGKVLIGDKLVQPNNHKPNYDDNVKIMAFAVPGPINPCFRAFPATDCVIRSGKYRSDISLGFDANGGLFMVRCASQKKKRFWSRRHATDYRADLSIGDIKYHLTIPNEGQGVMVKVLTPFLNSRYMPKNKVNCSFEHFNTGCCEGAEGHRDFTIDFSNINW